MPPTDRLAILMNDEPVTGLNLLQKGMQSALLALGVRGVYNQRSNVKRLAGRALGKFGLIRPLFKVDDSRRIVVLTWASEAPLFTTGYFHEIVPWVYDCWGPQFAQWEKVFRKYAVRDACFSARMAAEHFGAAVPGLRAHWVPEACDPALYSPHKPLVQRSIGVLELGRKSPGVHEAITGPLAAAGVKHVFSSGGSERPIFQGIEALYRAMGDTVISMCFPKSITHPEGAGGIETVTQRYFETMGSGALAMGKCPAELRDLFGFDPVIELSKTDPLGQLIAIAKEPGAYQAHVDRCRARLLEVGTFAARATDMLAAISGAS